MRHIAFLRQFFHNAILHKDHFSRIFFCKNPLHLSQNTQSRVHRFALPEARRMRTCMISGSVGQGLWRDANGNELQDSGNVTVIKDLKVNGRPYF